MIRSEDVLSRDAERGLGEVSSDGDQRRWICIHAQPNKELFAAQNLRNQSYHCYLPTVSKVVRHARRTKTVRAPLFPRYLFVNIDVDVDQWRPILGTFGVSSLVMDGGRPKAVPFGVVETLLEATDTEGNTDFRHNVHVGQQVRIMSGPFFDLVGRLEQLDSMGRVTVLLDILGGQRSVNAGRVALQPEAA